MELWDLYNEHRELTRCDHVRGEPIPDGCYHLVVHAWIRNSQGQYLISQRSASRPTFPLQWECVGGSALKGEDSLTAVLREIKEEVGLGLTKDDGRLLLSQFRHNFRDIRDTWLWEYDGEADLSLATTDEVAQVKWMTVEEIRTLFNSGAMVHTMEYFFTEVLPQADR